MSEIIDTQLGRFRRVTDGKTKWFLFECPTCKEWLPLTEAMMNGEEPAVHESATIQGTRCPFSGSHEFGSTLVAAIQAGILSGVEPIHDEDEDRWHRQVTAMTTNPTAPARLTPLVERLRNARMMVNHGNGDVRDEPDPLHEEAADYIEELEKMCADNASVFNADYAAAERKIITLSADARRVREEALEEAAKIADDHVNRARRRSSPDFDSAYVLAWEATASQIAAAIRALSAPKAEAGQS